MKSQKSEGNHSTWQVHQQKPNGKRIVAEECEINQTESNRKVAEK
jgi:hypothetical protein